MIYAGVDVGGTNIKIGLVDIKGAVIADNSIKTDKSKDYKGILEDIVKDIRLLCEKAGVEYHDIAGIGLGVPGVVDSRTGTVSYSANLGWKDVPIVHGLEVISGIHAEAANDANCAAWGEYKFGASRSMDNVILVTLGTGVGSGIIIEGKLFDGVASAGGEAGHMIIVKDGKQCNCGLRGCWERYASATALAEQTEEAMQKYPDSLLHEIVKKTGRVTGKTAFLAAERGDKAGKEVVENYIDYLATGLINLGNIFHPNAIIIGGGVSHEGEALIAPLEEKVNSGLLASAHNPKVRIIAASLGNKAGVIGAAALVM